MKTKPVFSQCQRHCPIPRRIVDAGSYYDSHSWRPFIRILNVSSISLPILLPLYARLQALGTIMISVLLRQWRMRSRPDNDPTFWWGRLHYQARYGLRVNICQRSRNFTGSTETRDDAFQVTVQLRSSRPVHSILEEFRDLVTLAAGGVLSYLYI